jgi:hypothetical protein
LENGLSDENLVKQFLTSTKCEVCGQCYQEDNISILGHDENMWVLQVCCGSCHSQSLLAALMDEDEDTGSTKVEILTDLLETELEKFTETVVTADDVLDMCIFLAGFRGSFSQLLS